MKKSIGALLFSLGVVGTLASPVSAYKLGGSCNGVTCSAVLNMSGKRFYAGTYANQAMKNISVKLDGKKEWWADKDNRHNSTQAYTSTNIGSIEAWSYHHADNNSGDPFDRSIGFKNGAFYRR